MTRGTQLPRQGLHRRERNSFRRSEDVSWSVWSFRFARPSGFSRKPQPFMYPNINSYSASPYIQPDVGPLEDSLIRWAVRQCISTNEALGVLHHLHYADVADDEMWPLIQARAYQLFCDRDGLPGHALSDWLQAEREIHQHFEVQGHEGDPALAELPRKPLKRLSTAQRPLPTNDTALGFSQI